VPVGPITPLEATGKQGLPVSSKAHSSLSYSPVIVASTCHNNAATTTFYYSRVAAKESLFWKQTQQMDTSGKLFPLECSLRVVVVEEAQ